ncbi:MAG: hypothetical protein KDJ54_01560 [Candidatus Competibacteraceae bacterium]|nr:hypothetical protein [Candidatus Competibacteraceae bacterium]
MLVFTWTLGSRKLREEEARVLKLLSGIMMMGLGLLLLFYPEGLSDALASLLVIVAALALTGVTARMKKMLMVRFHRGRSMGIKPCLQWVGTRAWPA